MGRVATLAASLAASLSLLARPALAQTVVPVVAEVPARVRIEAAPCGEGPFATRQWLPLLRNELATDGVTVLDEAPAAGAGEAGAAESLALIRVEFACRPDATELTVSIDDALTHKSVRRVVALDDVAVEGRARAFALAVAELLRVSWAELCLVEPAPIESPAAPTLRRAMLLRMRPPLPRAEPPSTAARVSAPWEVSALLEVRSFPGQSGALIGPRGAVTWRPWGSLPLRLRADLGAAAGTAFARRGEVDLLLLSGGVGALFGGGNERLDFSVGPRVEFGWARAEGVPEGGGDGGLVDSDAVVFASVTAALRVALTQRWWAALDVSAGQTLRYVVVRADGDQVTGLRGPMLLVGIGLGVALGGP